MDRFGKKIREELKIMILGLLFAAAVAYWVYKDANERGSDSAFLWAAGVFAMMIVFLPLYLIRRPDKKNVDENIEASEQHVTAGTDAHVDTEPIQLAQPEPRQSTALLRPVAVAESEVVNPMPLEMHANKPEENSILCPNCGQYFDRTVNFCPHCGSANNQMM